MPENIVGTIMSNRMVEKSRLIEYLRTAPLSEVNIVDPAFWSNDAHWAWWKRLRTEAPVHYCTVGSLSPYWSVTRWEDIMEVINNHTVFSSSSGATIRDLNPDLNSEDLISFINMDPPMHGPRRKAVTPSMSSANLLAHVILIRERTVEVLNGLPRDEPFDWVDRVSTELATQMLATLFDFPFEERRKLSYWSDIAMAPDTMENRTELMNMLMVFTEMWNVRVNAKPKNDLISMLAHNPATRNMLPMEFMDNLKLLIIGGSDTMRSAITGGVYFLHQNPKENNKLRNNPAIIESLISEIIRFQTPLAHMRRTALENVELNGQQIYKGDKVVLWYVSGNRDERIIENPDAFIIDRLHHRKHMSYGSGIHRCIGNKLAELQLKILWEEILLRFPNIEVLEEPDRVPSPFANGYMRMMVRIPSG